MHRLVKRYKEANYKLGSKKNGLILITSLPYKSPSLSNVGTTLTYGKRLGSIETAEEKSCSILV
jgi:hypothetical protein